MIDNNTSFGEKTLSPENNQEAFKRLDLKKYYIYIASSLKDYCEDYKYPRGERPAFTAGLFDFMGYILDALTDKELQYSAKVEVIRNDQLNIKGKCNWCHFEIMIPLIEVTDDEEPGYFKLIPGFHDAYAMVKPDVPVEYINLKTIVTESGVSFEDICKDLGIE